MQQMAQEFVTCDSVDKWMWNCNDAGLGLAWQFTVWPSFYCQNVSPPVKFTINWYSCVVTTELEYSMSGNGADGLKMVEQTSTMMTVTPIETAHHGWKRIQHERSNWFWKTNMPQFEICPLQWSRPSELSTTMSVKNRDKIVWNS
jgi:hypothetical protein